MGGDGKAWDRMAAKPRIRDRATVLMVGKKRIDRELIRLMGFENC